LYYRFQGANGKVRHIKKIPLNEFEDAIKTLQGKGAFGRTDYTKKCPESLLVGLVDSQLSAVILNFATMPSTKAA